MSANGSNGAGSHRNVPGGGPVSTEDKFLEAGAGLLQV